LGTHICVFILRGLFSNWKFVLIYFVPATNIKYKSLIFKNIFVSEEIGFSLRGLVFDQGGKNRKGCSLLGVTKEIPFFTLNYKKYFGFFDIPHLFKSKRNSLLKFKL